VEYEPLNFVSDSGRENALDPARSTNFWRVLDIYGICKRCRRKSKAAQDTACASGNVSGMEISRKVRGFERIVRCLLFKPSDLP